VRLYFGGGSDVNGAELGTDWNDRLSLRFSKLVSNNFYAEEYNVSVGGGGNHRTVRQLLTDFRPISSYDAVIIGMTSKYRTEYHDGKDWKRVKVIGNTPSKWWLENKLSTQKEERDFWREYFRIHSDEFFTFNERMYHTTIKNYCKLHNVPLILIGRREISDLEFDFCFDEPWISKAPKGHPDEAGHRAIADRINSILLFNKDFQKKL